MNYRVETLSLAIVTFLAAVSFAQGPKQDLAAVALLDKARQAATVQQTTVPSFALQASFETFDYKGNLDGSGKIEEMSMLGGAWKRTIIYRGQSETVFAVDGKQHYASENFVGSFVEAQILRMFFEPVPAQADFAQTTLTMKKLSFGPLELTCVIASLPSPTERDSYATAPNAAYCIDPATGILRAIEGHNEMQIVFNNIHKAGPVSMPFDISIRERGLKRATLHVDKLTAITGLALADLALPPAPPPAVAPTSLPGNLIAGRIVKKEQPVYPDDAKQRRVQGTVVLHAIIGKDGAISDLELVSAPDDSLVNSAIEAVRKWKYVPYTLDGKPVEVDTIIKVNYRFG